MLTPTQRLHWLNLIEAYPDLLAQPIEVRTPELAQVFQCRSDNCQRNLEIMSKAWSGLLKYTKIAGVHGKPATLRLWLCSKKNVNNADPSYAENSCATTSDHA